MRRDARRSDGTDIEQRYVRSVLEHTGGNVAEAARRAGVSRATLFRLIRRHGIKSEEG